MHISGCFTGSWLDNIFHKKKNFTQLNFTISFALFHFRQIIPLVILEEGSYEKDVLFYVNIGEPQMVGGKFNIVSRQ